MGHIWSGKPIVCAGLTRAPIIVACAASKPIHRARQFIAAETTSRVVADSALLSSASGVYNRKKRVDPIVDFS